ncbi:hypothetical protein ACHAQJ_000187 [Trichoderma viride]
MNYKPPILSPSVELPLSSAFRIQLEHTVYPPTYNRHSYYTYLETFYFYNPSTMGSQQSSSGKKSKKPLFRRSAPLASTATASTHDHVDQRRPKTANSKAKANKKETTNAILAYRDDFEERIYQKYFHPCTHRLWGYTVQDEKDCFNALWSKYGRTQNATVEERASWDKDFKELWTEYWTVGTGAKMALAEYGYDEEEDDLYGINDIAGEPDTGIGLGIFLPAEPSPPPSARTMPPRW